MNVFTCIAIKYNFKSLSRQPDKYPIRAGHLKNVRTGGPGGPGRVASGESRRDPRRVANFALGRVSRGAGLRSPKTLPTLSEAGHQSGLRLRVTAGQGPSLSCQSGFHRCLARARGAAAAAGYHSLPEHQLESRSDHLSVPAASLSEARQLDQLHFGLNCHCWFIVGPCNSKPVLSCKNLIKLYNNFFSFTFKV